MSADWSFSWKPVSAPSNHRMWGGASPAPGQQSGATNSPGEQRQREFPKDSWIPFFGAIKPDPLVAIKGFNRKILERIDALTSPKCSQDTAVQRTDSLLKVIEGMRGVASVIPRCSLPDRGATGSIEDVAREAKELVRHVCAKALQASEEVQDTVVGKLRRMYGNL